jgi:hypothetical protein
MTATEVPSTALSLEPDCAPLPPQKYTPSRSVPAARFATPNPNPTPDTKADATSALKIRLLFVDQEQKEWSTRPIHDITDCTFTVRRATPQRRTAYRRRSPPDLAARPSASAQPLDSRLPASPVAPSGHARHDEPPPAARPPSHDVVGTASILKEAGNPEEKQSPPAQSSKNSPKFNLASTSIRNTQKRRKASPVAQEF